MELLKHILFKCPKCQGLDLPSILELRGGLENQKYLCPYGCKEDCLILGAGEWQRMMGLLAQEMERYQIN